jgi:hypothetical protein
MLEVSPELPWYHWIVNGPFPAVLNESCDDWPLLMVCGEANGPDPIGAHVTVTVVAWLSDGGAHCPVTRTQ